MNKALYEEYAFLEQKKDEIEAQQKELKGQIYMEMKAELHDGETGVDISLGSFTLQKKITYKYSDSVESLDKQLKKSKAAEVAKGIAQVDKTTEFVVFRPVKVL